MSFLGNASLVLAAISALVGVVTFLLGTFTSLKTLLRPARLATFCAAGFMTFAVAILLLALLSHDFSLNYVYFESMRGTPTIYLISALWAGNAGSLLFWGWLVTLAGAILLWRKKASQGLLSSALPIILTTTIFFLILIFLPNAGQNPFNSISPVPADGLGMNPLLQNLGMVFHPPALLIGWALTLIPFAMTLGALITRQTDNGWLGSARRWALVSWIFLGAGNIIGAWWAYYELNWGGYWAWDPVENAGLIPWILITAFLHSTMTWRRRDFNKTWSVVFAIFAFLSTIFGAYLTRSDILDSVHTFGTTPAEPVFVAFMAIILVGAFTIVILRRKELKEALGDDALISGETTFFANNLLLALATFLVLVGTLGPFLSHIAANTPLSRIANLFNKGTDFFNSTAVPLLLAAILLSGICVLIGFKKPKLAHFRRTLIWPTASALILVLVLFIFGINKWYVLVTSFILAFTLFATITKWLQDISRHRIGKRENYFRTFYRLFSVNRARYGGYIVHIAIVIIATGVMGSSVYKEHLDDVVMSPNQSVQVQAYTLTYTGYTTTGTNTAMALTASFDIKRGDKLVGTLYPALNYRISGNNTAEAAVRSTLADDVYISIYAVNNETREVGAVIMVNPLVTWIWIGGVILFLGGLWAFSSPAKKTVGDEDD